MTTSKQFFKSLEGTEGFVVCRGTYISGFNTLYFALNIIVIYMSFAFRIHISFLFLLFMPDCFFSFCVVVFVSKGEGLCCRVCAGLWCAVARAFLALTHCISH